MAGSRPADEWTLESKKRRAVGFNALKAEESLNRCQCRHRNVPWARFFLGAVARLILGSQVVGGFLDELRAELNAARRSRHMKRGHAPAQSEVERRPCIHEKDGATKVRHAPMFQGGGGLLALGRIRCFSGEDVTEVLKRELECALGFLRRGGRSIGVKKDPYPRVTAARFSNTSVNVSKIVSAGRTRASQCLQATRATRTHPGLGTDVRFGLDEDLQGLRLAGHSSGVQRCVRSVVHFVDFSAGGDERCTNLCVTAYCRQMQECSPGLRRRREL